MAWWLLKADPGDYGWEDLQRDTRTVWDGVRNPLALKHLRAVRRGDRAFVYHTGKERRLVGCATIVSDPYPDPDAGDPRRVVVDLEAGEPLPHPVTLAALRQDPRFADFALLRLPRLSVMPVEAARAKLLLQLARG